LTHHPPRETKKAEADSSEDKQMSVNPPEDLQTSLETSDAPQANRKSAKTHDQASVEPSNAKRTPAPRKAKRKIANAGQTAQGSQGEPKVGQTTQEQRRRWRSRAKPFVESPDH
jgi:hypothetical protein